MGSQTYPVQVQHDYLEKMTRARPVQALCELIWNSFDADAQSVRVVLNPSELKGFHSIVVIDDGTGIPRGEAPELFGKLGGSWKRAGGVTKKEGRFLHGQEGRGRFKALGMGRVAEWDVTYERNGELWTYTILLKGDSVKEVSISDEQVAEPGKKPGVSVTVSELDKSFRGLEGPTAIEEFTDAFALYLTDYKSVSLMVGGVRIDPESLIATRQRFELKKVAVKGVLHLSSLEVIEWKKGGSKALYLCNARGAPLLKVDRRFHTGASSFSAYLKSSLISDLQTQGTLELAQMNSEVVELIDESQKLIKQYFRERAADEAKAIVETWKEEKIYPFEGEPNSPLEKAERQVFEIVAVSVAQYVPDFEGTTPASKALQLRLLKSAIESSPEELQVILGEVLRLPMHVQKDFAQLLRNTSLSAIIGASKLIADRLKFLAGLEAILFDSGPKKRLKERSQLHRIIADNPWIFGEEFSISVDDRSLTEVLRKHRAILGDHTKIDEPVKHVTKERGIVDLVLSRTIRRYKATDLVHLVVELKAPSVKVKQKELSQTEEYSMSIRKDERFRGVNITWQFWVISDDYDDFVEDKIQDRNTGYVSGRENHSLFVKTWSQILEDNRARLQFFQERLEYQIDKTESLEHLQERYSAFLQGVIVDEELVGAETEPAGEELQEPDDGN